MADDELLEQWLAAGQQLLQSRRDSARESELATRLEQLEARLEARGVDVDDLDDEKLDRLTDRILARLDQVDPPQPAESADEPEPEPAPEPQVRLPRQRVTELGVPRIWNGDDEPDHVRYVDEDGKETSRRGRKKGAPAVYDVEEIPDEPAEPAGGEE